MQKIIDSRGFTLIELVVVMAIIATLSILVVGAITVARRTALETQHRSDARTIQTALEAYHTQYKIYPDIASDLDWDNTFTNVATFLNSKGIKVQLASPAEGCGYGEGAGWVDTYADIQPGYCVEYNEDWSACLSNKDINYVMWAMNADCSPLKPVMYGP